MEILFMLIPLSLAIVLGAGLLLVWALRSGQYDNLDEIGRRLPDSDS